MKRFNLRKLLNSIEKSVLINFLPSWYKFLIFNLNDIEKSKLIELIIDSASLNKLDVQKLSLVVDNMEFEDFVELVKYLNFTNISKVDFIEKLRCEELKTKELNKLHAYLIDEITNNNDDMNEKISSLKSSEYRFYELLDYQMFIKQQILQLFSAEYLLPRVLIHMPTGTGKTKTSMHTLVDIINKETYQKSHIIWIAHTTVLLEQAIDTLGNVWYHLGYGVMPVYNLYDGKDNANKINDDFGFIFITTSTLISLFKNNLDLLEEIRNSTRAIVFDEAHKLLASETRKAVDFLMKSYDKNTKRILIGLTATPGRSIHSDEENMELAEYFERRIISIDPKIVDQFSMSEIEFSNQSTQDKKLIKYFQDRGILSKLRREKVFYKTNEDFNNKLKKTKQKIIDSDYNSKILDIFAYNFERNYAIIERLSLLAKQNIPTIFFSCSVEHGKFISSLLKFYDIKSSQVYGEYNSKIRELEIRKFKNGETKILINFNVLSTGFDSTNIKCVFISRPTKSIVLYSQMIGRGLRGPKMGGNEECLLIDVEDNLNMFNDENDAFNYFEEYWK